MALSKKPQDNKVQTEPQDQLLNELKRSQLLDEMGKEDPALKLFANRTVNAEFDGTIEDGKL